MNSSLSWRESKTVKCLAIGRRCHKRHLIEYNAIGLNLWTQYKNLSCRGNGLENSQVIKRGCPQVSIGPVLKLNPLLEFSLAFSALKSWASFSGRSRKQYNIWRKWAEDWRASLTLVWVFLIMERHVVPVARVQSWMPRPFWALQARTTGLFLPVSK
jgi:hypothetical protein